MITQSDAWVVFSGVAFVFLIQIVSVLDSRAIIAHLNLNHHVLWIKMGCPSFWRLVFTRGHELEDPGPDRINILGWLSDKEYLELNDSVLTRLAQRERILDYLGLFIVVLVLGYGLLRHYGVLAAPNLGT
jgi:hypothetical protein